MVTASSNPPPTTSDHIYNHTIDGGPTLSATVIACKAADISGGPIHDINPHLLGVDLAIVQAEVCLCIIIFKKYLHYHVLFSTCRMVTLLRISPME